MRIEEKKELKTIDYYKIAVSYLMLILGAIILYKVFTGSFSWTGVIIGAGILVLGLMRVYYINKFLQK